MHEGIAKIVSVNDYLYGASNSALESEEFMNEKHNDDMLMLALERIRKEYEELEEELKSLEKNEREQLLGFAIYEALSSTYPKQSIRRSICHYRRMGFGSIGRMIYCVLVCTSLNTLSTQQFLRSLIK